MNQMVNVMDVIMQRMEQDLRQVQKQITQLGKLLAYQSEIIENLRAENIRLQSQSRQ